MSASVIKSAAILLAAGQGQRAQTCQTPKQYQQINEKTLLEHSLDLFVTSQFIHVIILVVRPQDAPLYQPILDKYRQKIQLVTGGATRQASTFNALLSLKGRDIDYVYIHDVARPFTSPELLRRLSDYLSPRYGIIPVLPATETIKQVNPEAYVVQTLPRHSLVLSQTPQVFPYAALLEAHSRAAETSREFTDDASILEYIAFPILTIEGERSNIKVTYAEDFKKTQNESPSKGSPAMTHDSVSAFPDIRSAIGYDVHRLIDGDHITLCGYQIPHHKSLLGHSDADVALHALTDALLATLGDGDIGTHFPPSEARWAGADSKVFVRYAVQRVQQRKGKINNIDITLICEQPKIGPHVPKMKKILADLLEIKENRVSIKATTNEELGFIGRGEGIAAFACTTVYYPGEAS